MSETETIVMSVGGSLIVPDAIDTGFLSSLKTLIENQTTSYGRRFIIIAGGGKTARRYQDAAKAVTELDNEDVDWLGLRSQQNAARAVAEGRFDREIVAMETPVMGVASRPSTSPPHTPASTTSDHRRLG